MANETTEILRGRTIRTSNEAYEKFRQISQENFESQGQCFSTLIHLYELEQGKTVLADRKMEIENFQMHINSLLNMFVNSLQMNEDAEERVKASIQDVLDTKDRTIVQLQKERNQVQSLLNEKNHSYNELQDSFAQFRNSAEEEKKNLHMTMEQLNQTIADKNELISLITGQKQELQEQIMETSDMEKKLRAFESDLSEKEQKILSLSNQLSISEQMHAQEIEKLERQMELEKEKHAFELEKALLDQEKDLQLSWEQEKLECNRKLELYQMKYVTALERIEEITSKKEAEE
jgi:uncharacterized phage infection (PIP) family protein YhgE